MTTPIMTGRDISRFTFRMIARGATITPGTEIRWSDPMTASVVEALAAGDELPGEFTILDTYADCGDPPSWEHCRKVCIEVRDVMNFFGLPIRTTYTMLDAIPDPDPDYS